MLQHGAYTLLMDACYDRERFPTEDEAIDWLWAASQEEIEAIRFVLSKFFSVDEGVYVQKHIQEALAKYHANAKTNKRIAIDREAKRRGKDTKRAQSVNDTSTVPNDSVNEAPPNQELGTSNQEPITSNQEQATSHHSHSTDQKPSLSAAGAHSQAISRPVNKPKASRKTQMPKDFVLTPARSDRAVNYWVKQQRPDLAPAVEFEKFVNHHRQHGKTMACWESTWTTWYTNAVKFNPAPPVRATGIRSTRDMTLSDHLNITNW